MYALLCARARRGGRSGALWSSAGFSFLLFLVNQWPWAWAGYDGLRFNVFAACAWRELLSQNHYEHQPHTFFSFTPTPCAVVGVPRGQTLDAVDQREAGLPEARRGLQRGAGQGGVPELPSEPEPPGSSTTQRVWRRNVFILNYKCDGRRCLKKRVSDRGDNGRGFDSTSGDDLRSAAAALSGCLTCSTQTARASSSKRLPRLSCYIIMCQCVV